MSDAIGSSFVSRRVAMPMAQELRGLIKNFYQCCRVLAVRLGHIYPRPRCFLSSSKSQSDGELSEIFPYGFSAVHQKRPLLKEMDAVHARTVLCRNGVKL